MLENNLKLNPEKKLSVLQEVQMAKGFLPGRHFGKLPLNNLCYYLTLNLVSPYDALSWLQMHCPVVVWIIAILYFVVFSFESITRLQNIQNCLAGLVSIDSRYSPITPTLRSLH